jgi:hypothetical protein
MKYEAAYRKAIAELAGKDAHAVAENSGATLVRKGFALKFLGKQYLVTLPDGEVFREGKKEENEEVRLLLLHYLVHAKGVPVSYKWKSYSQLPQTLGYARAFHKRVEQRLGEAFEPEGFLKAGLKLGGREAGLGDASFILHVLPRLPVLFILWSGGKEFDTKVRVLFDESASSYLPGEDLAVIMQLVTEELLKYA